MMIRLKLLTNCAKRVVDEIGRLVQKYPEGYVESAEFTATQDGSKELRPRI